MKKIYSCFSLALAVLCFVACSKSSNIATPETPSSQSYKMYNYSSGSAVEAGSLTLQKTDDGNASIAVNLNDSYLVPGKILKAYLIVKDTILGIEANYANLSDIDGATGFATTAPLINSSTNVAIKYDALVSEKRYSVKVYNSNTVQAIGKIE